MPQRAPLHGRLTPRENLRLFARLEGLAEAEAEAERLLRAVDLLEAPTAPQRPSRSETPSASTWPSACWARPRWSSSTSPRPRSTRASAARSGACWRTSPRGGAVVFATQNVEEAHLHATRVVVLIEGAVVFDGPQAAFWERAGLEPGAGAFEAAFVAFLERTEARA